MAGVVIVGGGQAAVSLSSNLRVLGYDGLVTIFCDEPYPPYQRPPLSKGYLLGEMQREQLFLKPEVQYEREEIDLRIGTRVDAIDRNAKCVRFGNETLSYSHLVLTTGSVPRRLPEAIGGTLAGVHTVRGLGDIDALAPDMRPERHLLIVGGGYIGLEAAAVARKLALNVTLIEAAPRILQRVAAPQTSDFFRRLHTDHGVRILENTGLERLIDKEGHLTGALLSDGDVIPADLAIVGIGVNPATSLAQAAGLGIENGIAVDEFGRTSDPSIWAAGDCASFPMAKKRIRLESVGNAIDQAKCVACNIVGTPSPYVPKPWFWSDQYDVKLQIAGLSSGFNRVVARIGLGTARSHWYFRDDQLLAVDAINDARAYMVAKRLIDADKSPPIGAIEDLSFDLKLLLQSDS